MSKLSFVNTKITKSELLTRIRGHIAADNIIRGVGWNGSKGCAVGCSFEYYDHARAAKETNVPEWLWRVEDALFEGMSSNKSKTWPDIFASALPEEFSKMDFEKKVKAPFMVVVLKSALTSFDNKKFPDVTAAVNSSIALWQRDDIGSEEFLAEAAAEAAARAAEAAEAAWAARAAEAAEAAWAARAARAAEAAARAAEAAEAAWAARAARAARASKFDYFADELIKILERVKYEN